MEVSEDYKNEAFLKIPFREIGIGIGMFDDGPSFSLFDLWLIWISQNGISWPLIKFLKIIEEKVKKNSQIYIIASFYLLCSECWKWDY